MDLFQSERSWPATRACRAVAERRVTSRGARVAGQSTLARQFVLDDRQPMAHTTLSSRDAAISQNEEERATRQFRRACFIRQKANPSQVRHKRRPINKEHWRKIRSGEDRASVWAAE